ncbi:MAG: hypothetical protein F6J94_16585 [Moorea sp. SIO1F2]|uniref:alr0857 family protein n=1 Tax=unclassified Moorena TaxID=2683338 RepID=UPI0013B79C02|nr:MULTISPECIES: alr0857 family protein [unclassified Moorena]NEN99844.1 hypothetical protein [Moorena sp. SIO3I7]NEO07640.1 hypothetical protein [Moorena sp. SIO3I8]NEO19632.1 hypothetical protein [Moorena sp. SIO4A5]NEQ59829.1 hypothetical protein [Moorena sp. SIO4A1]NET83474.1 hypothetical protein [Moorena sp. SIO1F2]
MLKLIYTENSFYLERLAQSLEEWVTTRTLVSLRAGASFYIEPSTASFLLPANLPHLRQLEVFVRQDKTDAIALSICDAEYVEVSLQGTWLTSDPEDEEGIFVTAMNYAVEFFLYQLWQEANHRASVPKD